MRFVDRRTDSLRSCSDSKTSRASGAAAPGTSLLEEAIRAGEEEAFSGWRSSSSPGDEPLARPPQELRNDFELMTTPSFDAASASTEFPVAGGNSTGTNSTRASTARASDGRRLGGGLVGPPLLLDDSPALPMLDVDSRRGEFRADILVAPDGLSRRTSVRDALNFRSNCATESRTDTDLVNDGTSSVVATTLLSVAALSVALAPGKKCRDREWLWLVEPARLVVPPPRTPPALATLESDLDSEAELLLLLTNLLEARLAALFDCAFDCKSESSELSDSSDDEKSELLEEWE